MTFFVLLYCMCQVFFFGFNTCHKLMNIYHRGQIYIGHTQYFKPCYQRVYGQRKNCVT